jgi:hypothetical protein
VLRRSSEFLSECNCFVLVAVAFVCSFLCIYMLPCLFYVRHFFYYRFVHAIHYGSIFMIYVCVYICMYIYIYIYTHTHTQQEADWHKIECPSTCMSVVDLHASYMHVHMFE